MAANIAIFGATSAIAQALARRLVHEGATFLLAGRDEARLRAVAADLASRGARAARVQVVDFASEASLRGACEAARTELGALDLVIVAHGSLPDQRACETGEARIDDVFAVNLVSHAVIVVACAEILRAQRSGTLVVLGSVAGDRGKASNYLYGAAKAGLAVVQQGAMARLHGTGAHAMLVKLGFVDTPMTAAFHKGLLWTTPDRAAASIVRALEARRHTIYVPWFWRWIMFVLGALPDRLFVRLGL